jgi:hypothetical protein
MNRRSLFAAFALSPIMAVEAFAKQKPEGEPHNQQHSIVLTGIKKQTAKTTATVDGSGNYLTSDGWLNTDPDKAVRMSVGEDGNLWLMSKGDNWKRVVTE